MNALVYHDGLVIFFHSITIVTGMLLYVDVKSFLNNLEERVDMVEKGRLCRDRKNILTFF